jgi:hypothetical protein
MGMTSCKYCVHFVNRDGVELCSLGMPLEPCEFYEREPVADDDLETARARLKQREREIRESFDKGLA